MGHEPQAKQAYHVPRSLTPEQLVIRVREDPSRALGILANYPHDLLSDLCCDMVRLGFAITFSVTSDGGAVSISVYDGPHKYTCYGRSDSHLARSIQDLYKLVRREE